MRTKKITPETAIKKEIKQYLSYKGWFHFHILQGLASHKGICDIIAIKNGVTLYIEVKTPKGKLSEYQEIFKADIERSGGIYLVARSFDDVQEVADQIK